MTEDNKTPTPEKVKNVQCIKCRYYWGFSSCLAFPDDDIPPEIRSGEFPHIVRHPTQKNRVVFEPRNDRSRRNISR